MRRGQQFMNYLAVEDEGKTRNIVYSRWGIFIFYYYQILSYDTCDTSKSWKFVSETVTVTYTAYTPVLLPVQNQLTCWAVSPARASAQL